MILNKKEKWVIQVKNKGILTIDYIGYMTIVYKAESLSEVVEEAIYPSKEIANKAIEEFQIAYDTNHDDYSICEDPYNFVAVPLA